jgi:small-conductance mechanosensitive channel
MGKLRRGCVSAVVVLLLGPGSIALAQGAETAPESAEIEQSVIVAPVVVDGKVLFTVRGVSALPAAKRAARVAENIVQAARDPAVDPAAIQAVEIGGMTAIMAGDRRLTAVVDADAQLEGVGRTELVYVVTDAIRGAIIRYRADRQPDALIAAGLRALATTAVLALVLVTLLWLWRRVDHGIAARVEQHLRKMGVESVKTGGSERAGLALRSALRAIRTVVVLVAVVVYLQMVLGLFPWTRPFHAEVRSWFITPLTSIGEGIVAQIPNVIFLVILVLLLRWLIGLIRLVFLAVERGSVKLAGFDPEWAMPTFKIIRVVIIAFGVVVAYPYIPGSSSAAFKGVSLFAGVVFSLGSSSVISNILAGFTMTYRRAFRVDDIVRIGDVVGQVADIRLQVTHIRTPKNEEVVIPNSTILTGEVTNYSTLARTRGLILHTTVGIGYETPWRQVEAMLLMAAERTPGLLREPAPFVLQKALGDFAVTYELNVACDQPQAMPRLYHGLHRSILDVFNEYGIQIMTPAYEGDPEQPKLVPREQWFTAPASAPPEPAESESG